MLAVPKCLYAKQKHNANDTPTLALKMQQVKFRLKYKISWLQKAWYHNMSSNNFFFLFLGGRYCVHVRRSKRIAIRTSSKHNITPSDGEEDTTRNIPLHISMYHTEVKENVGHLLTESRIMVPTFIICRFWYLLIYTSLPRF